MSELHRTLIEFQRQFADEPACAAGAPHRAGAVVCAAFYLVMFIGLPLRAGLRALEQTRSLFLAMALGTIVAVASAYPLLTGLGITGAAVGILLVEMVTRGVLMIQFAGRSRSLSRRQDPKPTTVPRRDA